MPKYVFRLEILGGVSPKIRGRCQRKTLLKKGPQLWKTVPKKLMTKKWLMEIVGRCQESRGVRETWETCVRTNVYQFDYNYKYKFTSLENWFKITIILQLV